jgi:FADH2-dependent halogenase
VNAEPQTDWDAIVIGGGPAGSITAQRIAAAGHRVLLLERRTFPRFHIGESMLPYTAGILDQLGVLGQFPPEEYPAKWGAEFCGPTGGFRRVDFTSQGGGRQEKAFQCERAQFDNTLLRNAEAAGTRVLQEARVLGVITDGDRITGVRYVHDGAEHEARARYVMDASGRAGVISHQHFKARRPNEKLQLVAYYRHYTGVDESTNPGEEGDIQVGHHDDGWLWAIPIHKDVLSIGAVTKAETVRGSTPEAVFEEHLSRLPRIRCRVENVTDFTEVRGESDYCYYSNMVAGPGWFSVGDAACFVDPVFSAGVYLAVVTGVRAGDSVNQLLAGASAEGASEEEVQTEYSNFYKTGYDCYTRLIYAFYESNFNFGRYVQSLGNLSVKIEGKWIARLLSGDFWSRQNPVAELLRDNRDYDTFQPFPVAYGCPVYPEIDAAESAELARAR